MEDPSTPQTYTCHTLRSLLLRVLTPCFEAIMSPWTVFPNKFLWRKLGDTPTFHLMHNIFPHDMGVYQANKYVSRNIWLYSQVKGPREKNSTNIKVTPLRNVSWEKCQHTLCWVCRRQKRVTLKMGRRSEVQLLGLRPWVSRWASAGGTVSAGQHKVVTSKHFTTKTPFSHVHWCEAVWKRTFIYDIGGFTHW